MNSCTISFHVNQQNLAGGYTERYKGPILWIADEGASIKKACPLLKELPIHTTKRTKERCRANLLEWTKDHCV